MSNNNCDACDKLVKVAEKIICANCNAIFHHVCVNLSLTAFKKLNKTMRAKWICPSCQSSEPLTSTFHTPLRKGTDNADDISECTDDDNNDIRRIIRDEIRTAMRVEIRTLIKELRNEMADLRKELDELKSSGAFDIQKLNDVQSEVMKLRSENAELQSQNAELKKSVSQITHHFNALDQTMRDANLEIHGLPESKNELLPNIILQIAKTVSLPLNDNDIMKCTRVASVNKASTRPRTVIVKLRSPRCRDEFLSSVNRYNKSHVEDKLNASFLGFSGNKSPIFVSEHLSPANKSLHACARLKAKEKGFKFVWVKYGKIFVRKNENSGVILIRDEHCLGKIV